MLLIYKVDNYKYLLHPISTIVFITKLIIPYYKHVLNRKKNCWLLMQRNTTLNNFNFVVSYLDNNLCFVLVAGQWSYLKEEINLFSFQIPIYSL